MRAGLLRQRVTIQAPNVVTNAYGEPITSWVPLATVWGSVLPLAGREAMNQEAGQVQATVQQDVRIRWRSDVSPRMRLVVGARALDVESVEDPDGRRRVLRLLCREVV